MVEWYCKTFLNSVRCCKIFGFADWEDDLDRIEGRDRGEHCAVCRTDEIADLRPRDASDALDRRRHLAEVEIQLCLFDICLERFDFGCVRFVELYLVGVLLFGNHLLAEEFLAAFSLRLRRELHRLSLPELTLRLGKCGLKWPRVDLEEDVALFHERTFLVIALEQVAGYSCSNVGVLRTIESADPFAINRHVARRRVLHEHVWRRQGFDCFLLFARR